ncbi:acyl-CoA dehydrogenase family protein [Amycolatopsis sp. GM8]|uniref:acyl-CoA dehydrogenase family protein n=1 Tax=Amycolatopsis sp. GM8 TaxID=2896530 RepID=UPI001F374E64|nr:acyl-CoA dehydrogenase family protein [Amycolatopsis sp. GM8]
MSTMEDVASFRLRARAWLAENMPRIDPDAAARPPGDDDEEWTKARELQQKLHSGGFAGICFPVAYGGLGLTPAHQEAFTEESLPYQMPLLLNVPTFSICAPTILDMGTEEQKTSRIGAAIRGEEILCQFLSEPSGGSDLAGLITRADRDGDTWVLNGAKTWSTSAYAADWALCLARTDWDAPKHRGLTMFLMPTKAPGVTMNRIRQVNGSTEFCEEFFDDVVLPASAVVGEVNDGWRVASRQLFHERTAVGGGSPYVSGRGDRIASTPASDPLEIARVTGRAGDPAVRERIGAYLTTQKVQEQLVERVSRGIQGGQLPPPAASFMRLLHAEADWERNDIAVQIAGALATTGTGGAVVGVNYLMRQGASLGGGSTEMSRNIISERVLGMPREFAADRDIPFGQVKRARG